MSANDARVIIVQPVVPSYRRSFFNAVEERLERELEVHASLSSMGVLTNDRNTESWFKPLGDMVTLIPGLQWQHGAVSISIKRGDLVVVSGAPRCLSNLVILIKARIIGARTVWWGQLWSSTTRWHRFVLRLLLMRMAHSVLLYTDVEVTRYMSAFNITASGDVGALNNGIDVREVHRWRVEYRASSRKNEILFIGRLTDKANIMLLLEAMGHAALSTVVLNIIGDGPNSKLVNEWVRSKGLERRVIVFEGTVVESSIARVANRCALFCYPGGVGLSLIHAMAYGLPSVVHGDRTKHMPEIAAFDEGVTGRSFVKGDVASLANTIATLICDEGERDKMSMEAMRRVDETYNTSAMAGRFIDFAEKVSK